MPAGSSSTAITTAELIVLPLASGGRSKMASSTRDLKTSAESSCISPVRSTQPNGSLYLKSKARLWYTPWLMAPDSGREDFAFGSEREEEACGCAHRAAASKGRRRRGGNRAITDVTGTEAK